MPSRLKLMSVAALFVLVIAGCGTSVKDPPPPVFTPATVNSYFALPGEPAASAGVTPTASVSNVKGYTFTINHTANEFDQESITSGSSAGPVSRGSFTAGNGFLSAALNPFDGVVSQTNEVGNWVLEEQGLMGFAYLSAPSATGLSGSASGPLGQNDTSQNLIPFVSNTACPNIADTETYQYLTFPQVNLTPAWNYLTDAAYGSVTVATTQAGTVVNLTGIQQFLLPGATTPADTAVTVNPGPSSISGGCGTSLAGQVVSFSYTPPAAANSTTPGTPTYAEMNLASGFLLEYNRGVGVEPLTTSNILGAGFGAVGLLKPSSAVSVSSLVGTSFQGFVYEPGPSATNPLYTSSYTSTAAFGAAGSGCAALQSSLATLATPPSANTIYGGEYTGNDPVTNTTANCDIAVDLGTQDANNNGLFPAATIYVGSAFPLNNAAVSNGQASGKPYSFPAVAIAGQINNQNAIFVLGEDTVTSRPVGIYLLQASQSQ